MRGSEIAGGKRFVVSSDGAGGRSRGGFEDWSQAMKAVHDAAPGKTRDEIRGLLIAELQARGVEPPSEPILGAAVDMVSSDPRAWLARIWSGTALTFS
jgi:hypothetical protein